MFIYKFEIMILRCALTLILFPAIVLMVSCTAREPLSLQTADSYELSVSYTSPDRTALDADFRDSLKLWLGEPADVRATAPAYETAEAADHADDVLMLKIQSAKLEFIPFVFDENSQYREYMGKVNCRAQLWYMGKKIDDWNFSRQRPFSVQPRQHQLGARLREIRAELAIWAVEQWFDELRWRVARQKLLSFANDQEHSDAETTAIEAKPSQ